ncbi:aminoacyl-tRNA deacylase [Gordonia sp. OPL2]|uniref:aminoacyl-tRNA deacylase n=1 Tax=Gordonia sp. OPL2 TaxID=2486274 RepID=UPI0016563F20|nr:aminoacyl-tRNA deacylase [Gordonia sp. OPL2]ROZ99275.1 aminoacyl-tRNA deacylase [Gordonia sp. OPL2]
MAATPALTALEKAGVAHTVHRYPHDPRNQSYGDEAVEALQVSIGVSPDQVLKTLVVEVGSSLVVAVVPVPHKLSLKAVAAAVSSVVPSAGKAHMAPEKAVTRATGYVFGGVSPIGQRTTLPTVVDSSALDWPQVCCSAGRRGLEVQLAPADLVAITQAVVADIAA